MNLSLEKIVHTQQLLSVGHVPCGLSQGVLYHHSVYQVKKIISFLKFCINSGGANVGAAILRGIIGRAYNFRIIFIIIFEFTLIYFDIYTNPVNPWRKLTTFYNIKDIIFLILFFAFIFYIFSYFLIIIFFCKIIEMDYSIFFNFI